MPNLHGVVREVLKKPLPAGGETSCTDRASLHGVRGIQKDYKYIISHPSLHCFPRIKNPKTFSLSSKLSVVPSPLLENNNLLLSSQDYHHQRCYFQETRNPPTIFQSPTPVPFSGPRFSIEGGGDELKKEGKGVDPFQNSR